MFRLKAGIRSNSFLRFLLVAGVLYTALYLIYQFVVRRYTLYDQAFIGTIVNAADLLLQTLGYDTFKILQDRDLQVIGIDGSNGVWIGSECNAITLFGLFAVFVIAYPGNQRDKFWFIPAGILAIHLLNILRVSVLAIIAAYDYTLLDFNHTYTFNFIMYAFIFGLWMLWVNRYAQKSRANEKS